MNAQEKFEQKNPIIIEESDLAPDGDEVLRITADDLKVSAKAPDVLVITEDDIADSDSDKEGRFDLQGLTYSTEDDQFKLKLDQSGAEIADAMKGIDDEVKKKKELLGLPDYDEVLIIDNSKSVIRYINDGTVQAMLIHLLAAAQSNQQRDVRSVLFSETVKEFLNPFTMDDHPKKYVENNLPEHSISGTRCVPVLEWAVKNVEKTQRPTVLRIQTDAEIFDVRKFIKQMRKVAKAGLPIGVHILKLPYNYRDKPTIDLNEALRLLSKYAAEPDSILIGIDDINPDEITNKQLTNILIDRLAGIDPDSQEQVSESLHAKHQNLSGQAGGGVISGIKSRLLGF